MRNWYLGKYKKEGENVYPFKQEAQKNEILGPSVPPLFIYVLRGHNWIHFAHRP